MKQLFLFFIFSISLFSFSQKNDSNYSYLQASYFYGNIIEHNKNVGHLIINHPIGFMLSWNKKTTGKNAWESRYNYPDFGISFSYQDYKSPVLGRTYSIYGHYNFYLIPKVKKDQLVLRFGWGLAYNTDPYDKVTNPKNIAFGSTINSAVYLNLFYKRENIIDRIGVNAGLSLMHTSNASFKSPNSGINVWAPTIGVNYNLSNTNTIKYIPSRDNEKYTEKLKFNFALRFGVNEIAYINSGIKPFYVLSAFIDKRIGWKSAIQFGGDYFTTYVLKNYMIIRHNIDENYKIGDYNRVGVFIGHELFLNKLSLTSQLGYYVYYPIDIEGRLYERISLKRYINNKWFTSISLKAHMAKAETASLGIGIRL